jgi:hypothetical protein
LSNQANIQFVINSIPCLVQVVGVDRAAGTVKVSRKALLDAADASADAIAAKAPDPSETSLEAAPTFPVIPPRKFSQDYFL